MVPHGHDEVRRVGLQIGSQPLILGGAGTDGKIAVQYDDVPFAELITVVAGGWITGCGPEVAEVAARVRSIVLMIADRRSGTLLVSPQKGS